LALTVFALRKPLHGEPSESESRQFSYLRRPNASIWIRRVRFSFSLFFTSLTLSPRANEGTAWRAVRRASFRRVGGCGRQGPAFLAPTASREPHDRFDRVV